MDSIKYQMNLTLLDNKVLKAYETEEVKNERLTLKFLKSDATKAYLKKIFTQSENLKTIHKTTTAGKFVCTFDNYIKLISITESLEVITVSTEQEIATNVIDDSNGNSESAFTTVTKNVDVPTDMVIVTLGYVSTLEQKVNEIVEKVAPTVDIDSCTLEELQDYTQEKNKMALANFLANNPILWSDGEYYGVKQEDQMEMALDLSAYQIKVASDPEWKLEWHNIKKACREFTLDEYNALMSAIIDYVYPYRRLQESYKEAIYTATTKNEVMAIELKYELPLDNEE